jgi:hypothetical protein
MAEKIEIKKTVFPRNEFQKVVNTSFTTFTTTVEEEELTVEDFFTEYERLYFEIPVTGEVNSHEYLIRRSSELVRFEEDTLDIQPLLEEISSLREQLLTANQTILELQIPTLDGQ